MITLDGDLEIDGPAGKFRIAARGQLLYVEPNGHTRWANLWRNRLGGDQRLGILLDRAGLTISFRGPLGLQFFAGHKARRGPISKLLKTPWALNQGW